MKLYSLCFIFFIFFNVQSIGFAIEADYSASEVETESTTIAPEDPTTAGLAKYPNNPLSKKIAEPVSVPFVIHHRSALNGNRITVSGVVLEAILGEDACPPLAGGCAQPRIFIAETKHLLDLNYRLMVLVSEEDRNYSVGEWVEIEGIVHASQVAVYVQKTK